MVRGWSVAARQSRFERAVRRGFIVPRKEESNVYIEVDKRIALAVKTVHKSMKLHMDHDTVTGGITSRDMQLWQLLLTSVTLRHNRP